MGRGRTTDGRSRGRPVDSRTHREEATTYTTEPLLYTLKEAAQALRISRTKLYELMDADDIEFIHIGRSRKIPADALYAYINRLRHTKGE
jgi:excisionase family DNA binding protein